ncbi:hypothetical protein LX59_01248 [Azomonas agilis]|uniref:Prepilin-type N-terminal cleavage/methylation domain-containing protein n=1 Tax=Azomonas agilis TaxID=116849 RepID=A0A562J0J9_9GAMM|nr:hypothetical protein [Azomonas agilis]TWH76325.1 hypothetical protein LX59_01248 [Azomonas agilis]
MNLKGQKGSFLIESLVGALLISILAVGLMHTAIQVERSRSDIKTKGLAVIKMREVLNYKEDSQENISVNLCIGDSETITIPDKEVKLSISPICKEQSVTVNGIKIDNLPKEVTLTIDNLNYFGGTLEVGEFND